MLVGSLVLARVTVAAAMGHWHNMSAWPTDGLDHYSYALDVVQHNQTRFAFACENSQPDTVRDTIVLRTADVYEGWRFGIPSIALPHGKPPEPRSRPCRMTRSAHARPGQMTDVRMRPQGSWPSQQPPNLLNYLREPMRSSVRRLVSTAYNPMASSRFEFVGA